MNTKKNIELLKKAFQRLENEFSMETFEDDIDKNTETIYMPFPREDEIEIEVDDLLKYFMDFDSIKIHDSNKVTTDRITQRVVTISELTPYIYMGYFFVETADGIQLSIRENPI